MRNPNDESMRGMILYINKFTSLYALGIEALMLLEFHVCACVDKMQRNAKIYFQ